MQIARLVATMRGAFEQPARLRVAQRRIDAVASAERADRREARPAASLARAPPHASS